MASALWGKFASDVLKEVKFKYDHTGIRRELLDHMEELYEDLQAEGMDADVAEIMAAEYMGDAKEIGQALNKEHSPVLGWLWLGCRRLVLVLLVLFLLNGIPIVKTLVAGFFTPYWEKTDSPLVYKVPLEKEMKWYGEEITMQELRYYADGTLELRGTSLDWNRHWGNVSGFYATLCLRDEDGRIYVSEGGNGNQISLESGLWFRTQAFFHGFPLDAEKAELQYGRYGTQCIEIELSEGRDWQIEGDEG